MAVADQGHTPQDALGLLDWKRRVFGLYAEIRAADDHAAPAHARKRNLIALLDGLRLDAANA